LSEPFLLSLFWGPLEEWPPIGAGPVHPEQSVGTLPLALALAKDATLPLQALPSEETWAPMPMAALRPPPHPVDAFARPPGPNRVSPALVHTPLGTLPLRPPALTSPWLAPAPWTETNAGVPVSLLPLVVDVPPARDRGSPPWCRDGRREGGPQPLPRAQRSLSAPPALDVAPPGAWQRRARLGAVGRRGVTASARPLGSTPCQSGRHRRHALVGVPRLSAAPLGLAPRPPRPARAPARLTPLPRVPCPLGLRLPRRCALPLGALPLTL
jgi:hypothetical protein